MKPTAQQLNEWLSANHQDAINAFEQQGMTLRFVDGPENYHQDHASLAVGATGVGFTFQTNHQWEVGPVGMVEDALSRKDDFQPALAAAEKQYGAAPLPIAKPAHYYTKPLMVGHAGWHIANNQEKTTPSATRKQRSFWSQNGPSICEGPDDVADMVHELCERQALYDRLRTPEGVLSLVREPGALVKSKFYDAYEVQAVEGCHLSFGQSDTAEDGVKVTVEVSQWNVGLGRDLVLKDKTTACLSANGIRYETDGFDVLTPAITAKDLNMDPLVMNTMADMGVAPLDILRFDAQKAEAETSAGEDYLQSLDGDIFASESTEQGFML